MMGAGDAISPLFSARSTRPKVAVLEGADAQRSRPAQSNSRAIRDTCEDIGCEWVAIPVGPAADAELLAAEADLAMSAVLDSRLDDGGVAELCEGLEVPFAGSPAAAQRKAADKVACGAWLARDGIEVPKQKVITRGALQQLGFGVALPAIAAQLGSTVMVKPVHGSAGHGVRRARSSADVPGAVLSALSYDDSVVIEPAIEGHEYTVLVAGGPRGSWAVGIAAVVADDADPRRTAAWARSYRPFPSGRNIAARQRIAATARRAADAIGCMGLATVDVIVDARGGEWVIDIDCQVDWTSDGRMAACLASNDLSRPELLASVLTETLAPKREAA